FTFFAYMIALVDPEANTADTLVFALMHTVTIPDIIGPGLYKLTGSATTDMTLIGPIITTTYAADNTLLLSCNLSDLMADPDFSNWYNPADPKLGFGAMTNRITLSIGTEVADQTSSCNLIPYPIQIDQTPASLPVLTDIQTSIENDNALQVSLNYQSPEAYLPVTAQILFDTGFTADFIPAAFPDFNNPVPYAAQINLSDIQGWSYATLRFSPDGANYTNNLIYPTAVSDAALNPVPPMVNIYPNPTNGCFSIDTSYAKTPLTIRLYDIKGRKLDESVTNQTNSNRIITYDLNSFSQRPDGIYLLKMDESGRTTTRKITLIK
ncbi:MAG: T9SS type A sorting domain-containing protein, partial [Candidatus Cloacimonadaceae bacterium]